MKSIKKRLIKACKRDPILKRLEMAVRRLNEISTKVSIFLHLLENRRQEQQQQQLEMRETRETGSLIKNVLVGRSKEMELISQWLTNQNHTQSSDTTDLYRNVSLLSVVGHGGMGKTTLLQHVYNKVATLFDVKMWVCVSTNFNAKTVIANILKSLKREVPNGEPLDSLQTSLQSEVTSKRFLLVLDDIWEADEEKWKNVFAALQNGNPGSKILISTRIPSVASTLATIIKNNQMFRLEGLEKDDCLQLFNKYAFALVENPGGIFRDIAEKMVEKLSRCPLAIKFIGDFLKTCVDETFWTNVLNTNIGHLKPEEPSQNYLLPILKLSYTHLPGYLQNCFSFCSIFPQDYEFDKDDLVRMWIALDFIQSSDILEETLENTGKRYFDILVQKSFFDKFHTHKYQVYYKMHDLLHDLAQSVSIQECYRVVDDKKLSISKTIRHLSIKTPSLEVLKEIEKFKHLRSLFLPFSKVVKDVISQILEASKSIRLLVIDSLSIEYNVPETIDCLIHLRYLKATCSGFLNLPSSISHLYHLQFVIPTECRNLMTYKIGWEELRPNKTCHLILDELVIKDPSVLLMEPLRSISDLRCLTIMLDELVSFPSETEQWLLQQSSSLSQLNFEALVCLESLPSFSTFSSLKCLRLQEIWQLKSLSDLPSSLKLLELRNLYSLQCLPSSLSAISTLDSLQFVGIPLLKSLPDLPSSLKVLKLEYLNSLQCLPSSLSAISSLDILVLRNIPLPKSLPDLPSSLKELQLEDLESLQFLPSSLSVISSLDILEIRNIPLLKSLPDLPSSPKVLKLKYLESLQFLPSSLSAISSLDILELRNIPLLKSLPDLPSSLATLQITRVRGLLELPTLPASLQTLSIAFCHPKLMKRYRNF